ncbi:FimV/HubP family polar landmark protein [Lysobacter enzymogenes]|uniref:FimV/HubP family polar landmark protein n=1 Tax=Lysobacter enzymogenes TaxID=69 RepID=UPI000F4BF548|nr:FimV/HubP family polar landmark protein [Lysobacter enzymogenes]
MRSGFARTALGLALALASSAACALGLGQIEVKSRAGQPLLAEIPVIASGPEELAQLRAGLASPETFQRIGLEPPQGIVTDLRFTLAVDRNGKPIIRVTSTQPVQQPLLTFLIEVDWGQGRLTREYSALLDAPRTASAPMQPPIQAAAGANPNTIERPLEAPLPFGAQPQQTDPLAVENPAPGYDPGNAMQPLPPDALAAQPEAPPPQAIPDAAPPAAVPAPAERPNAGRIAREPRPRPAAPAALPAEGEITVARGQTLSGIAAQVGGAQSLNQTMIALLRANPEAFVGGNINRLRAGAVLRRPPGGEMAAIDPREANELVRAQIQQWRQAPQQAVPQPLTVGADRVAKAPVAPAAREPGRASDARLEIVPPGAERAKAGAQSGVSAAGEGHMVREQVQQANETIAVREQELADLKSKVAELEKLSTDQQKLIAMKDSELAATQQRLAENQARADSGSPLPWIFGGLGLLALLAGGWVLSRREPKRPDFRAAAPAPFVPAPAAVEPAADPVETLRRKPEPAPLADPVAQLLGRDRAEPESRAGAIVDADVDADADAVDASEQAGAAQAHALQDFPGDREPAAVQPVVERAADPVAPPSPPHWTAPVSEPKSQPRVPTWHSASAGSQPRREAEPAPVQPVPVAPAAAPRVAATQSPSVEPRADAGTVAPRPAAETARLAPDPIAPGPIAPGPITPDPKPAAAVAASPGLERIELARAYLDLGDEGSARQLLGEVLINGDHAARQQAARLLRELEGAGGGRTGS